MLSNFKITPSDLVSKTGKKQTLDNNDSNINFDSP